MKTSVAFICLALLGSANLVDAAELTKATGRQTKAIEGWTLLISDQLLDQDKVAKERAWELLTVQLQEIVRVVPAAAVVELRKVPLWFSSELWGEPLNGSSAVMSDADPQQQQLPRPDGKPGDHSKPIKVYVMLGQSNMLGFGRVGPKETKGSLEFMVKEKGKYSHLVDENGQWTTRLDVRYVHVMDQRGVDYKDMEKFGDVRNEWLTPNKSFGPELGFGHVMGHFHNEPVLLLKACIGNRSLGWDLLPPGSERFEFEGKIYAGYKDVANFWDKGAEPKPVPWYAGRQYDADTAHAKAVLKNPEKYYPGYKGQGHEVAGFVWWQGHKDQSAALAGHYEQNLVRLIKSLRQDFNSPKAKFVLATGCGNPGRDAFGLQIAEAQLAVDGDNNKYPEFKGNVKAVDTRELWREADVSPVNQGYHYNHNAETYYEVGDAMGRAMTVLLQGTK